MKPIELTDDAVMGGGDMAKLLPDYLTIPSEFKGSGKSPYLRCTEEWFGRGLDARRLESKDGVDRVMALRHMKSIMSSWSPRHEHKISGVAYLLSLWFWLDGNKPVVKTTKVNRNKKKRKVVA